MTNHVARETSDGLEFGRGLGEVSPPTAPPGCTRSAPDSANGVYLHAELSTPEMLAPIRGLLRERFAPYLTGAATDDVVLVAHELLTRSLSQDRQDVILEAVLDGDDVDLRVSEALVTRHLLDSGGGRYAQAVIDGATRAWGVEQSEGGTTTWARLAAR